VDVKLMLTSPGEHFQNCANISQQLATCTDRTALNRKEKNNFVVPIAGVLRPFCNTLIYNNLPHIEKGKRRK